MVYRAIGLMSGSSLDGLDLVFAEFHENGGKWSFEWRCSDCYPYSEEWKSRLSRATSLNAFDYQLLHAEYGHYLGRQVNRFIEQYDLHYQVGLIASHGHTSFHLPARGMTAQLGDGAAIAAETGLPVVTDLRSMDVAFGGQGAPIVPIGEQLLLGEYQYYLNLGGIANISSNGNPYIAFDICPANRVLNLLAGELAMEYDADGAQSAAGTVNTDLLNELNSQEYYRQPWPKSLANEFGTDTLYPIIKRQSVSVQDALCTYTEHIATQVAASVGALQKGTVPAQKEKLLVTGGGALNSFLTGRLRAKLMERNVELVLPDNNMIQYKEALIMALIGILRWREEINVLSSVTGARRDSVGGAMWM